MNGGVKPAASVASDEIAALIETLHRTGNRLEELTGGEVDAVLDRDGRPFLLHHAQDAVRQYEANRQAAILDALPANIALLDAQGVVVSVNAAWRRFAAANTLADANFGIGRNYLALCERFEHWERSEGAPDDDATAAQQAGEGIRAVLSGQLGSFALQYPCHSPREQRWFLLSVSPLTAGRANGVVVMHLDITAQYRADRKFKELLEATPDAMLIVNSKAEMVLVNGQAIKMFGWQREELIGQKIDMLIPERFRDGHPAKHNGFMAEAQARPMDNGRGQSALRRDGSEFPIEISLSPLDTDDGTLIISAIRDITERQATERRIVYLNRVHAMLSGINALIVRVRERDELFREACRIAVDAGGFRMAWIGIIDRDALKIVPLASAGVDDEMLSTIKERFSLNEDLPLGNTMTAQAIRDKTAVVANDSQNDPRLVFPRQHAAAGIHSMVILPLLVADQAVGVLVLYAKELNFFQQEELKLLDELAGDVAFAIDHLDKLQRLDYLAYYDEITGLANRRLFLERVSQYMRGAVGGGHQLAVFLTDLERFRNINDSLGRPAGDELLRQVTSWMIRTAGDASLIARIGADLFAVVLPEVRPDGDLARMLDKMIGAFLGHSFRLTDSTFHIAARGGVALFPEHGADAETLVKHAEAALKNAKASGVRYLFYTPEMSSSIAGRLGLENELRRALDQSEFVLHYQPKVSCSTGKITGFEALLRWQHPQRGLIAPLEFVPALEESGLIVPVGEWVLNEACRQARRWHNEGLGTPNMAVNVSGRQIDLSDLGSTVLAALTTSGLTPACLELEMTEGQLMKDAENIIGLLKRLKLIGVKLSIDDFGTGYSSLAYLKRFPIDCLKVDRAFVRDITADPNDVSITRAIITLAHSLKLKVVAEGVETEGQLGLLIANHCDEVQGYYFSRPLPAAEATALLSAGRSLSSRMMAGMKRPRTLLLVDDEANILSALKRLLRKDGYEILTALGGEQGLELLAIHPVDVIVSDQRMPGMSGVDFLRRVKVLHPETVRLVLSGYTDLQSVTDAVNEGAISKFLTKPWEDEALRRTIGEAFRNKETADQDRRPRDAGASDEAPPNLPERGAVIDA